MTDAPWLLLFPYLPLQRKLDVGRWTLMSVSEFDGPWRSASFRQRSRSVIARHVDRAGAPLRHPSILVDQRRGADGVLPEPHEVDALQLALGLAVLDAVPVWRSDVEIAAVARHRARGDDERETELRSELTEEREVVHEGNLTLTEDTAPGSVYAGPFWRVATRVLRDAVLVGLDAWGFAGLWDDRFGRVARRAVTGET